MRQAPLVEEVEVKTSSRITRLRYVPKQGDKPPYLDITFKGDKVYRYHNVTSSEFYDLRTADSIGKAFEHLIKPKYDGARQVSSSSSK